MSLTKIDVIEAAYAHLDIPRKDCVRVVESLFEIIKDDLGKGNGVMDLRLRKMDGQSEKEPKGQESTDWS